MEVPFIEQTTNNSVLASGASLARLVPPKSLRATLEEVFTRIDELEDKIDDQNKLSVTVRLEHLIARIDGLEDQIDAIANKVYPSDEGESIYTYDDDSDTVYDVNDIMARIDGMEDCIDALATKVYPRDDEASIYTNDDELATIYDAQDQDAKRKLHHRNQQAKNKYRNDCIHEMYKDATISSYWESIAYEDACNGNDDLIYDEESKLENEYQWIFTQVEDCPKRGEEP